MGFYVAIFREAKSERNSSRLTLQEALADAFEFEEKNLATLHYDEKIQGLVRGYEKLGNVQSNNVLTFGIYLC